MNLGVTAQKIDTICVETEIYRAVVSGSKQVPLLKERITILNDRIDNFKIIISNLNEKDSITIAGYTEQITNLNQQIALYKDQISGYERLLKIERRKKRLAIAGGIVATGIMGYLYLTK